MKKPVLANSGNMERNTPKELVEMARRVLGRIDLDPASNDVAQETVKAGCYFTKDDSGLGREWTVRKWINPRPCTCNVQPIVVQSNHGNTNLHQMQSGEAKNAGVLFGKNGQRGDEDPEGVQNVHCRTLEEFGAKETKEEMSEVRRSNEQKQHKNVQIVLGNDTREESGENVHKVQENASVYYGKLPENKRPECMDLLVQAVPEGPCKDEADGSQVGPGKEKEASGREIQVQQKRKRAGIQEVAISRGQQQAETAKTVCSVGLDDGEMGENEDRMGRKVRVLRENGKNDARSLHPAFESSLPGNGSMEHGSGVPGLQYEQGKPYAAGLVQGQKSICPNCGMVGLSASEPSRVFLNPPYASRLFRAFVRHLIQEYLGGRVTAAVVITNNNTETSATQALLQVAAAWCFPRSRVRFTAEDLSGAAGGLQGQLITYFGDNPALFLAVFSAKGATGVPVRVPSVDLFNIDAARVAFEGRE